MKSLECLILKTGCLRGSVSCRSVRCRSWVQIVGWDIKTPSSFCHSEYLTSRNSSPSYFLCTSLGFINMLRVESAGCHGNSRQRVRAGVYVSSRKASPRAYHMDALGLQGMLDLQVCVGSVAMKRRPWGRRRLTCASGTPCAASASVVT